MSASIHPGATIDASARLGEGCVVAAGAAIGPGCRVGHHVVIHADTRVGRDVRIDDHATLGKLPMRAANSATTKEQELPPLTVGDACIVGTGAVLYRGAAIEARVLRPICARCVRTSRSGAGPSSGAG